MSNSKSNNHRENILEYIRAAQRLRGELGIPKHDRRAPKPTVEVRGGIAYMSKDTPIQRHLAWQEDVRLYFKKNAIDHLLGVDFFLVNNHLSDEDLRDEIKDQISRLEKILDQIKKEDSPTDIFISENGEVWREPRSIYTHSFRKGSKRHKLIRSLAGKDNCIKTIILRKKLGDISQTQLTKEKRIVNTLISNSLSIETELIECKKSSGYHINRKFRLSFKG